MTLQKKATIVSSATATLLIIIKLFIGLLSGSVAVLASAIDSVLDLIVSAFNYFAIAKAEQPADKTFNYGKGKIEALAAVIEGTIICMSGLFILYTAIKKLFYPEALSHLSSSIWVMLVSFILTTMLVAFLHHVAKKTHSMVIESDALHYKTDVLSNGAILLSLVAIHFTGFEMIDSIMGILISLYIIYSAYELIKDGVYILLDASLEEEIVENIQRLILAEKEISDFHDLKTRRSANTYFVDVHLVFSPGISLLRAHHAGDKIEDNIKALAPEIEWVINAHLDPYDDSNTDTLLHVKKD
ncbi:cation diffusion facilitator family transporter [Sulfurospirillum deleyianum]|uniref:Cation diffusion facilitator family transporter n=1 Tax=Sulfurospirillum deleyianum (strain ATCC 51133 / DSM 6946 / 5175) TaxID=525898 RepID=D1B3C8_SULD5|nr:cation diffusion facilitator family transporter [Sulfurospirillum deleyianum]ACZ12598.1 cation diffusion facilitator family transporter [Sulfurospirillum deleyianum DSM 6946]